MHYTCISGEMHPVVTRVAFIIESWLGSRRLSLVWRGFLLVGPQGIEIDFLNCRFRRQVDKFHWFNNDHSLRLSYVHGLVSFCFFAR